MPNISYPLLTHCPLCHALYDAEKLKLVDEKNKVKLYHASCSTCGHGMMEYIVEGTSGVSALGLITDVSEEDAGRYNGLEPLESEDCIEAHQLLSQDSRGLCVKLLDISQKLT